MTATWGPFVANIEPDERKAQIRCLRALTRVYIGPRSADAAEALRLAEDGDEVALVAAEQALAALPSIDRRRVLATFRALHSVT